MQTIDYLLDKNEKIIWRGKPNKAVYIATKAVPILFILVFFSFFFIPFCSSFFAIPLGITTAVNEINTSGNFQISGVLPLAVCGILPFLFIFGSFAVSAILPIFAYRHVEYLLTTKRALLADGVIGRDFKSVDYDKLMNIEVNVGLFDKMFGGGKTGAIALFSGETIATKHGSRSKNDVMIGIEDPYSVFKQLKEVAHDIKTDIEYPNQLRPETNPGYKTEYDPKDKA